jgi:thiosulfate dehydrogenase
MKSFWFPVLLMVIAAGVAMVELTHATAEREAEMRQLAAYRAAEAADSEWIAPSLYLEVEPTGEDRDMVIYGHDLIANTGHYYGPQGSISKSANGMNCQNCHLDAGTRPWGNNFGAVSAGYPQYRSRSNSIQSLYGRVNDCFERSLNGSAIDTSSYEMKSIVRYIKWLGNQVPKGKKPYGTGMAKLALMTRAADPAKGRTVYSNYCENCHGSNGEGVAAADGKGYTYPPLWGAHSFNDGAGLHRISNSAAFIKFNMPFKSSYEKGATLSDEEAWDVASFINSRTRPVADHSRDYPVIGKKPFDSPFGPYPDTFSAQQHTFGPYQAIIKANKSSAGN